MMLWQKPLNNNAKDKGTTMKYGFIALAALCLLVSPALADITVSHPAYAFQTAPKQMNGAVFVGLKNTGVQDVKLTSVAANVATMLQLHTMSMDNNTMEMREVQSFTIPTGGELELEPTGDHIMLMGLKAPLKLEATFPLTLTFDNGETLQTDVTVVKPGFTHANHSHH